MDSITSLSWIPRVRDQPYSSVFCLTFCGLQGNSLAVGTNTGMVKVFDIESASVIRTMTGHSLRVGSLAWNEHILSSGSKDRAIYHRDVRISEHHIRKLTGHKQEICGLKWNSTENQLASGGNDNKLFVWEGLNETPLHRFADHTAAVKAIAWNPHQHGILASGGGTADKKIRFWNTLTGAQVGIASVSFVKVSNDLISHR